MKNISSTFIAEILKSDTTIYQLIDIELAATLRYTTAPFDITYNGNLYHSNSLILDVPAFYEKSELSSQSITLSLTNVENIITGVLFSQPIINKNVVIQTVAFDNGIVGNTSIINYKGLINDFSINDNLEASDILLTISSHWEDFNRIKKYSFSQNVQDSKHSGDLGMNYAQRVKKDVYWGFQVRELI